MPRRRLRRQLRIACSDLEAPSDWPDADERPMMSLMLVAASLALTMGLTTCLIALLMTGMAIGVIVSNRTLAGSCGGADADCVCEKKERGECPHDEAHDPHDPHDPHAPGLLPPGERLISANLNRAL